MKFRDLERHQGWFALGMIAAGLGACKVDSMSSNSSINDVTASAQLQVQLDRTNDARKQIRKVRAAIAPLDDVISDLFKGISPEKGLKEHQLQIRNHFLPMIRQAFEQATKGMVQNSSSENGWYISKPIKVPDEWLGEDCSAPQVLVEGQGDNKFSQVTFSVLGCEALALAGPMITATFEETSVKISFGATDEKRVSAGLRKKLLAGINLGGCQIHGVLDDLKRTLHFECSEDDSAMAIGEGAVILERLSLDSEPNLLKGDIELSVYGSSGRKAAQIHYRTGQTSLIGSRVEIKQLEGN